MSVTATAICNFAECHHILTLERSGIAMAERSEENDLIAKKGDEFEEEYVESLDKPCRIPKLRTDRAEQIRLTLEAMKRGDYVIHGGYLRDTKRGIEGEIDLMYRCNDLGSTLGLYSYEAGDIKSSKSIKPRYLLQLCHYSNLIQSVQKTMPRMSYIITKDSKRHSFKVADGNEYYLTLLEQFQAARAAKKPAPTEPYLIGHCKFCGYRDHCTKEIRDQDHVLLTANIKRGQVAALRTGMKIKTLNGLAGADVGTFKKVSGLTRSGFENLQRQAKAQVSGKWEIKDPEILAGLPGVKKGDIYFDMESYPFMDDGVLEYMFGFGVLGAKGKLSCSVFEGRDRASEKVAFQKATEFLIEAYNKDKTIKIYHYAPYEATHMLDLASRYGMYESDLQTIIDAAFVDLYRLITRCLIMPTESYSLKDLEKVVGFKRTAEIGSAGDSMVLFDKYLKTGDDKYFDQITAYNEDDIKATAQLHRWLKDIAK